MVVRAKQITRRFIFGSSAKETEIRNNTPKEVAEQFFESYFTRNPLSQEEIRRYRKEISKANSSQVFAVACR